MADELDRVRISAAELRAEVSNIVNHGDCLKEDFVEEGRGQRQEQRNYSNDVAEHHDLQRWQRHDSEDGNPVSSPGHPGVPGTMTSDHDEELGMSPSMKEGEEVKMAPTETVATKHRFTDGAMGKGAQKGGGCFTSNRGGGNHESTKQRTQRAAHPTTGSDNNNSRSSSAKGPAGSGSRPQSSRQREAADHREPDPPEAKGGFPSSPKPSKKTRKPDREIYQPGGRRSATTNLGKEAGAVRETEKTTGPPGAGPPGAGPPGAGPPGAGPPGAGPPGAGPPGAGPPGAGPPTVGPVREETQASREPPTQKETRGETGREENLNGGRGGGETGRRQRMKGEAKAAVIAVVSVLEPLTGDMDKLSLTASSGRELEGTIGEEGDNGVDRRRKASGEGRRSRAGGGGGTTANEGGEKTEEKKRERNRRNRGRGENGGNQDSRRRGTLEESGKVERGIGVKESNRRASEGDRERGENQPRDSQRDRERGENQPRDSQRDRERGENQPRDSQRDRGRGENQPRDSQWDRERGENQPRDTQRDRERGENQPRDSQRDRGRGENQPRDSQSDRERGENQPRDTQRDRERGENQPRDSQRDRERGENQPRDSQRDRERGENQSRDTQRDRERGENQPRDSQRDRERGENQPRDSQRDRERGENQPRDSQRDRERGENQPRDSPHAKGREKQGDRETERKKPRYREIKRDTQRGNNRPQDVDRERDEEIQRHRERDGGIERNRECDGGIERNRERDGVRERNGEKDGVIERNRQRDGEMRRNKEAGEVGYRCNSNNPNNNHLASSKRYSKSDIRRPRTRTYSTSSASSGTSLDGPGLGGGIGEDRARRDLVGRRERDRGEGGRGQLQNRRRNTRGSSTDSLEESKVDERIDERRRRRRDGGELHWSPERKESQGGQGRGGRGGLLKVSQSDRQSGISQTSEEPSEDPQGRRRQGTGPQGRGRGILILPAHTDLSHLPAEPGPRLLFGGIRGGREAGRGRGGGRGGGMRRLWDPNNPDQKPALRVSQHASLQQQQSPPMYLQTGGGYGAMHFLDTDDETAGSPPVRQGEHFQQQAAAMAQAYYKYQNSDNPYPYNANPNPNTRYPFPYHTMPSGPYQIPTSNGMYPAQFYGVYRGQIGYPPVAGAGGMSGAGLTPEEAEQQARGELGRLLRAADSQELQLSNLLSRDRLSADGLDRMAQLRADLLTLYERVILTDIEFSDSQNLDQALWKNVFYQVIERFRQLLKDPSGDPAPHITTMLLTLLDEGALFFDALLQKLQTVFQFKLEDYMDGMAIRARPPHKTVKYALISAQRCLICQGDIARYREQASDSANYGKARSWYLKAQQIAPKNGRPYNQLALLAVYTKRKLDAVYYYMRSLAASNPILTAKESLMSLFEEAKRKADQMGRKRRQESEGGNMGPGVRGGGRGEEVARVEIWIRPSGPAGAPSSHRGGSESSRDSEQEGELGNLSTSDLNKRFILSFLHAHGKLFTKVGMESFPEVSGRVLQEFRALLRNSPSPLGNTRMLQIITINMFTIHNARSRGGDGEVRSVLQEQTTALGLAMFALLVQRCTELLKDTPADSILAEDREEEEEGMVKVSSFPMDLRELLPSVKVWSDWMLGHPDQWNPPPCSIEGSPDVWWSLAELCNALARVDHGEAPLYKADGDGGEGDEELSLLLLEEDRLLAGFVPLLAAPQEPCYVDRSADTAMAADCKRVTVLKYFLEALCGQEEPLLAFKGGKYVSMATPPKSIRPGDARNLQDSQTERESDDVIVEAESSALDEGDEDEEDDIRELRARHSVLTNKLAQQQKRRDKIQAVLQTCGQLELEVRPLFLVLDTNGFIDHLTGLKVLLQTGTYILVVPLIVITELDGLAKGQESSGGNGRGGSRGNPGGGGAAHARTVQEKAKVAVAFLEQGFEAKEACLRALTSRGSELDSIAFRSEDTSGQQGNNDDVILSCCLHYCKDKDLVPAQRDGPVRLRREVVLLTDDRNLRVKALTRNVPVRDIPAFLTWAKIFGLERQTLAEYQERLATAAADIIAVVEKTVTEVLGENERLRGFILDFGADSEQLTLAPGELTCKHQDKCELEWRPSLRQEDPEPTSITEDQGVLTNGHEEDPLQRLESATSEVVEFIFLSGCVESDCNQHSSRDCQASNATEQSQSELDEEDHGESEMNRDSLSAVNPECAAARVDVIVIMDEDESQEILSGSKISLAKKGQSFTVCPEDKNSGDLKGQLKSDKRKTKYTCNFCPKSFLLPVSLKLQQKYHNGENTRQRKCPVCSKSFKTNSHLRSHQLIHTGEKPYKCDVCSQCFKRPCSLKVHQRLHDEKPYTCPVCSKTFNTVNSYKVHERTHTGEKPFKCTVCVKSFTSSSLLKVHQIYHTEFQQHHHQVHTKEKPDSCKVCGESFMSIVSLAEHLNTHTGEKPFTCPICGKSFKALAYLKRHQRDHPGERTGEPQASYLCSDCGKGFRTMGCLKVHMRTHVERVVHKCPVCGKDFTSSSYFKLHQRIHTGERLHQCNVCGRSFAMSGHLTEHMRTHTGEKPFKCLVCEKCFKSSTYLKVHQRMHTGEKPYQCSVCRKSFAQKGSLKDHVMTHTDEGLRKCPVCGKGFTSSSHLNCQLPSHCVKKTGKNTSEEMSYLCSDCGKSFRTMSYLRVHMRTHSKREMHKCPVCGKDFTWASSLKVHQRVHTGEKPFKCTLCSKSFTWKGVLMEHVKNHTGEKQHQCHVCSKRMVEGLYTAGSEGEEGPSYRMISSFPREEEYQTNEVTFLFTANLRTR
ncbi:hypothetical protein DPEC_G00228560 [Dallia pectoralis]|uniref:Uncharacterized protein n=1 Tax=Dallia pectoralis TaxID=75939 RepID=A0ACC2G1I4_DALPE|nr:hypothetical protein DPEC_G00228560 [Dallia pectoralis]